MSYHAAVLQTEVRRLRAENERLLHIAEHLFAMVPDDVWRATGGDDGQGHYEGDYRAAGLRDELAAMRERAANSQEPGP